MKNYIFVCVGTNRLIEDSFGPRVGDILKKNFKQNPNIEVLGTMESPVHFQNAPIFLDYLRLKTNKLIIVDSAIGELGAVGNTYINRGGIELGKAFGKNFYFPANWNIKTIVNTNERTCKLKYIMQLAQNVAMQIIATVNEFE